MDRKKGGRGKKIRTREGERKKTARGLEGGGGKQEGAGRGRESVKGRDMKGRRRKSERGRNGEGIKKGKERGMGEYNKG